MKDIVPTKLSNYVYKLTIINDDDKTNIHYEKDIIFQTKNDTFLYIIDNEINNFAIDTIYIKELFHNDRSAKSMKPGIK